MKIIDNRKSQHNGFKVLNYFVTSDQYNIIIMKVVDDVAIRESAKYFQSLFGAFEYIATQKSRESIKDVDDIDEYIANLKKLYSGLSDELKEIELSSVTCSDLKGV